MQLFQNLFYENKNIRKSASRKKPGFVSKATLSLKEKPLITESIKRKVTEILRLGLFNKIKLLSTNKVSNEM